MTTVIAGVAARALLGTGERQRVPLRLLALTALLLGAGPAAAQMPDAFVRLRDVAPTIRQDMRYAGSFNFTGRPVPGYEAPQCLLQRPAAAALAQAQADLAKRGYHLKVYDCYRPVRAVRAFIAWAESPEPDRMGRIFAPAIAKSQLFSLGYLARRSKHSLGIAVDVGLVRANEPERGTPADAGACDGPLARRATESTLDFGTAYDCASPASATAYPGLTPQARANRQRLVRALAGQGFRNYAKEWWHFEYSGPTGPLRPHDFPVR